MAGIRIVVRTSVLVLLMFAGTALPTCAQGTGAIGGTVTDASGAVLPGANVSLSNEQGSVGGRQEAVTDERGTYQFLRLVSGTYIVKANMQGFRPAEQRGIIVNSDVTARADLRLELGALSEGVVVSGEAPLLDTTSVLKQTVMTQEVLQTLPNRNDVWAIARVIPGVVLSKIDVGGSESFLQSSATVHGSSGENAYYIDGMDVDSVDGTGSQATMYLDPGAYAETNFQIGGGSAETSKGGLIFNMVPRTGTNQWHGGTLFNGTGNALNFANYSPALKQQLLSAVPAAVLRIKPDLQPSAQILKLFDFGGWIAGPIRRDKMWLSISGHYSVLNQYQLGSYDANGGQVLEDNLMWTLGENFSWQVTKSGQFSYFNNPQFKTTRHRNGGGTFADSAARNVNQKYPNVNQAKFTTPWGSKMVFDVEGSRFRADDCFCHRPEVHDGDISHFDSVTNTYTVALPFYTDNWMTRHVANTSLSYFAGAHELKAGYQLNLAKEISRAESTSGMRAVYRNGRPDSVNTYSTPSKFIEWNREHAVYVQDKWTRIARLTVNAGVRFESSYGWQPATCQTSNVFIGNGACYPALKGVPNFKDVSPRVSAVYDIFGDGKTALKFAANRYSQPIGTSLVRAINPVQTVSDTRSWTVCAPGQTSGCDLNGDLIPQLNELGPSNGFSFGNTNRYATGLKRPISLEYTVELQRQIPGNVVVSAGYTLRQQRRNIGVKNVLVPPDSYFPLVVTEVDSGRQVTVYNQSPALKGKFDQLRANYPELDNDFNGGDITVNKRMSHNWALTGGVSFGKTIGNTLSGDLNNPNGAQFARGLIGNDTPYSYRLSGVFDLPYRISLSATGQYNKGFPETTTVSVGNNTVALTQGTQTVVVAPRGATRLPNVASVDVSVRFRAIEGTRRVTPRLDFYNLTNQSTVTARTTQLGPAYGVISGIQRGRLIKLGINYDF
ncbi:MAG TPA: TonB-dependent receptor [Vicinamibacterales bacterium]|jgi:hypothetical protein|nr:TonB-dependent receptor [Vicinamibacterales bacterium]